MCGIAGAFLKRRDLCALTEVKRMCSRIIHRGPDAEGFWSGLDGSLAFGHRRLSIIDLSELGAQPMTSSSGAFTVTYNGEIYNFREIRRELEALGYEFRGHSDTEVLVEAVDCWGVREATAKFIGMFAFAIWDNKSRTISLVRDRLGIKPLYYTSDSDGLLFASEILAFDNTLLSESEINPTALGQFFRHKYYSSPHTIYKKLSKLEPGCIANYSVDDGKLDTVRYWGLPEIARKGREKELEGSYEEQVQMLESLLKDAIQKRMVADVPLGAFLSGGIDSSLVCALMQSMSDKPIKTFTIGFSEGGYNEANHAAEIARHLETEHTEHYLDPDSLLEYVQNLPNIVNEPYADISLIPTLAVSRLASEQVTVALSGDGGDELFGGYNHYAASRELNRKLDKLPAALRSASASLLKFGNPGYGKIARLAALMEPKGFAHFYESYLSQWQHFDSLYLKGSSYRSGHESLLKSEYAFNRESDFLHHMMLRDAQNYMVDDILHKVDIASMHYSLEARVPLIDHRVFEFVWRMPLGHRVREAESKAPLKTILAKYVPVDLFERPKQGFGVPISAWLRGPLLEWAEEIFSEASVQKTGVLSPRIVQKIWREHKSGRHDRGAYLWSILCFEQWALKNGIAA